jgi:hypothetical protein
VKIGHRASGIGLDRNQSRTDPLQKVERQRAPDKPVDQITYRQALGGGIAADTA